MEKIADYTPENLDWARPFVEEVAIASEAMGGGGSG